MRRRRTSWIAFGILGVAALLWLYFWQPRQDGGSRRSAAASAQSNQTSTKAGADDRRIGGLLAAFATPINFYGKVVDDSGQPVAGATIKFGVADIQIDGGSYYHEISDSAGLFALRGKRGLSVAVWVSKEGYYATGSSRGTNFVYGGVRGANSPANPTFDKPAIFVLRKAGQGASLVHLPRKSIKVPKDGSPVGIDLSNGQVVAGGGGHIRIEVWTANQGMDPNKAQRYDWEMRLSVPDGGLVERTDEYAFEAPETGYVPSFEAGMQKGDQGWRDGFQKEFFAKLGNGQYARFYFRLLTRGDHFIVLDTYLNPMPGNRNLEFVAAKANPSR